MTVTTALSLSRGIMRWLRDQCVRRAFISPGRLSQNGDVESLRVKLRDEYPRCARFDDVEKTRVIIER